MHTKAHMRLPIGHQ